MGATLHRAAARGSRQRSGARRGLGGQAWEGRGQLGVAIGESPRPCLVVAFPLESDVSLSLCGVPDPAWDGAPSSFGPNHDPPPLSTSRAKRASERQTEKQDAVAAAVAAGSLLEKGTSFRAGLIALAPSQAPIEPHRD